MNPSVNSIDVPIDSVNCIDVPSNVDIPIERQKAQRKQRKPKNLRELRAFKAKLAGITPETHENHRNVQEIRKKCMKCGEIKPLDKFGRHNDTADGHQSYCKGCKNKLGKQRHRMNAAARLKHHFATRIQMQLGELCPQQLTLNLEEHLGYTFTALIVALRKDLKEREGHQRSLTAALSEGYHVDHIKALSKYKVIKNRVVDWDKFRECWAVSNLRAVPALDNLKKGARDE